MIFDVRCKTSSLQSKQQETRPLWFVDKTPFGRMNRFTILIDKVRLMLLVRLFVASYFPSADQNSDWLNFGHTFDIWNEFVWFTRHTENAKQKWHLVVTECGCHRVTTKSTYNRLSLIIRMQCNVKHNHSYTSSLGRRSHTLSLSCFVICFIINHMLVSGGVLWHLSSPYQTPDHVDRLKLVEVKRLNKQLAEQQAEASTRAVAAEAELALVNSRMVPLQTEAVYGRDKSTNSQRIIRIEW
mgnify:CR=1 FL=1